MTLAERAQLATTTRQRKAAERAAYVRLNIAAGMRADRAAYYAGVSRRTARRYCKADG
jgi:hypothetical protein